MSPPTSSSHENALKGPSRWKRAGQARHFARRALLNINAMETVPAAEISTANQHCEEAQTEPRALQRRNPPKKQKAKKMSKNLVNKLERWTRCARAYFASVDQHELEMMKMSPQSQGKDRYLLILG